MGDGGQRIIVAAAGAAAGGRIVTSTGTRRWEVVLTMVWVGGA